MKNVEEFDSQAIDSKSSMEQGTKSMQTDTPQLLPELIHCIQSLLTPKEAVRTCVLSKSWLHAFSTMPILRFTKAYDVNFKQEKRYIELIDRTLLRYLNDNVPLEHIDLRIDTKHPKELHPVVKWIQLASKSCLRELSLTICGDRRMYSFTTPDEIFSSESLKTLSIRRFNANVTINGNPMIKCWSLRVLELIHVNISEEMLNNLLSTCKLLEKLDISSWCTHLQTVKVKNLLYLQEFKMQLSAEDCILEIYNVPSVRLFFCHPGCLLEPFKRDSLRSVRELSLSAVIMDTSLSKMIKSEFPFLEVLTLEMRACTLETLDITCVSLKRLSLALREKVKINIVYASKLLYFCYNGCKMPSLLFPATTPEHIKLGLTLEKLYDLSFFLNMREMLNLSSTFDIEIKDETCNNSVPEKLYIIDDLRRRTEFPARNVQQLFLKSDASFSDAHFPKHALIFQALFSIFYPNYLGAYSLPSRPEVKNIMHELIVRGKLDKSILLDLQDVQIKNPENGQWETLTTNYSKSWRSSQDNDVYALPLSDEFKLNWRSSQIGRAL